MVKNKKIKAFFGFYKSVENGNNLSAGTVQSDFKNLNGRPNGEVSGENFGNQQRQYGINLEELSYGVEESFGLYIAAPNP